MPGDTVDCVAGHRACKQMTSVENKIPGLSARDVAGGDAICRSPATGSSEQPFSFHFGRLDNASGRNDLPMISILPGRPEFGMETPRSRTCHHRHWQRRSVYF